ncbi:MAG: T9SS type A sorting domain-containing protein, partial [Bacteroidota bacterium]
NSLDLSASIQEITYDDGGTPNDPFDDTWYVIIIATANNNSGTYTTNFPGLVGTYGQPLTLGPILCETDPVSILIQDSTNPSCTVTLHPDIPSNCVPNNCALTISQIEYLNCSNNGNDYCISFVVEDGGTGSPNGWITENGSSGQYGQPADLDVLCANTPSLLTIIDADDPNCIFTIELDPPANVCSNSCELTAQLESVVCSDDGQFYTATISFTGVEGDVFITQGGIFSSGESFVIQGIPTFMSPTFTIRSLEDPFCEVDVAVQAPDCEGCSIGFELSDPIYDDGGTPANTADDTYTIDVIVLGEFGSGSWITPNGLTGQYGVSTPFIFSCADETPMIEVFDAEDETCSASIDLTGFFTCPEIDSCNALTLDILFEEVECNELAPISINISGLTPPYFFTIYDDADLTSIYSQDTFSTDTSYTIDLPEGYYVFSLTDENGCEHIIEFFHTPQPNFGVSLFYAADEECGTTGTIYYPGLGQPFSCSDGLQNGDETGVDCGGICAPCNFEGLIIDIQDNHGPIGTEVCLDVTVRNFIDIASFQFGLSYYDFALDFTGFIPNSSLPGLNVTDSQGGNLVITWSSTDFEGVNLDDEEVLLSICFENTYGGASRIELSNFTTNQFFDSEENLLAFSSIPGIFYVADFDWIWILPNGEVVETNTISLPVDNQPGTYLLLMTDSNTGCVDTAEITLDPSLFLGCVSVTGTLWADEGSCALEGGEIPVPGWALQIYSSDGNFVTYVITDENGNWSAELPPGDYFAEPSPFQPDLYASCDPAAGFTVANTIPHVDVLMPYVEECVIMYTHVSVGPLRVCEQQSVQVFYCNDGPVVAENAQIEVTFDELLSVEQVSIPPAQVFNQTYVFDLGDLAPFECGTIEFTIMVACDVELGQSQCVEVIASPNAPCPTPDGSWSGATVEVEVACDEEEGVSFRIENTGMGDMSVPLEYMVIEDVIMMMGNPVISDPLEDGEVIDIELPADGTSYIVWANQEPGSPGALMPIASIEGCGTDENGEFTTGVINQFATSPPDLDWYRLVCRPITGSFDPNAKVGYPLGYGDENLIEPGTRLTYDLYFQNTGNDFANRVVLVDSLAEELDLGTIRLGGSSHPYTYTIDENRVLTIIFDDIMLPDSTSDPIGSQGVVQFSIDHLPDLPLGTIIENEVDIYFDFNAPITTNRTHHKLDREFLPTDVEEPINDLPFWYIYPNPTANWLWIDFPLQYRELDRIEMIATDLLGREVLRAELLQGQAINLKVLPTATYLLRFQDDDGRVLGKAELIKH